MTSVVGRGVNEVEFLPDIFDDGGERSDSDASGDEHVDLVIEHVLTRRAERSIHRDSAGKCVCV